MKNIRLITVILGIFLLTGNNSFAQSIPLSSKQKASLIHMLEEEKLAHDIYATLNEQYNNRVLENISNAETFHTNIVKNILIHYGLYDSKFENLKTGEFSIPELQALYNRLYEKGKKSLKDALEVGTMVEVTDVNDLNQYITSNSSHPDIVAAFTLLRQGSYNHYWAFDNALKKIGVEEGCCSLGDKYCKTPAEYPQKRGMGRQYQGYYWFQRN